MKSRKFNKFVALADLLGKMPNNSFFSGWKQNDFASSRPFLIIIVRYIYFGILYNIGIKIEIMTGRKTFRQFLKMSEYKASGCGIIAIKPCLLANFACDKVASRALLSDYYFV